MENYRVVHTDFWKDPIVSKEMNIEEKYFYIYLLTNPNTTKNGVYPMTKEQMALDLGYSVITVQSLIERFTRHHKLIRYNPETSELVIKNRGKYIHHNDEEPVIDGYHSKLKDFHLTTCEES
ncbi:hypothetical protein WQ54_28880 [Bacillus sp. SA1-12]|uniref:hypothetical protein n=1 Tax=Bacillus sp. SA1-12 TaxID=1455638 RepID=UPI0006270404|nr:hypothetical protein [Bacillus sp. SA1-12]KKI88935.1 hypothetical protein WQ54_28880 [Bacillus sp. SA1-12]